MALEAGIFSIIIGMIRGGGLLRIADLDIKRLWLAFIPALLICVMVYLGSSEPKGVWAPVTGMLHILAYLALLLFFWLNRRLPGMKWFIAGWAMNLLPIVANIGKMPVSVAAAKMAGLPVPHGVAFRHIEMSAATHFNYLADVIPVPVPYLRNVASPGDMMMAIGIFLLIQLTMCPRKPLVEISDGEQVG